MKAMLRKSRLMINRFLEASFMDNVYICTVYKVTENAPDNRRARIKNRKNHSFRLHLVAIPPIGDSLQSKIMFLTDFGMSFRLNWRFRLPHIRCDIDDISGLQDHLLQKVQGAVKDRVNICDVTWVLTVPAIWTDSAKQFMREAAQQVID